jgi:hypothetical protein
VARYESAAVRDEGKALVADYETSSCSNRDETTGAWKDAKKEKQSQRDLEY